MAQKPPSRQSELAGSAVPGRSGAAEQRAVGGTRAPGLPAPHPRHRILARSNAKILTSRLLKVSFPKRSFPRPRAVQAIMESNMF